MERNLLDIYKIKKRKFVIAYYFVALFLSVAILAGCFYDYISEPVDYAAARTDDPIDLIEESPPQMGGEIRVPVPLPDTFNPLFAGTKGLSDFLGIIFEGLFEFGEDLKPIPVLADSWEVKEQGRVWHIKLREGVNFHDGQEMMAEDVIFTFKALQSGLLDSSYARGLVGHPDIETMVADENDPYAVYVHLFEPIHNMKELLTFPILPQHVYQTDVFMLENINNLSFLPVGTGPFKADITEFDPLLRLRLVRNEDWWGGDVFLDSILGLIYEDETLVRDAFSRGDIDIFDSSEMFANVYTIGREVQRHSYLTSHFEFIGFNHEHPILSDLLVRRAIANVLDRQQIITVVYNGNAQDTEAPISPASWIYRSGHGIFDADIDKASALLVQAGWTGIDENGIRFKATETGTKQLKFRLLTNLESGLRRHAQEMIVRQLQDVGISVEVQTLPWNEFTEALNTKDFDAILTGYSIDNLPDLRFSIYLGNDAEPLVLYESEELNALMSEAARIYDQEKLKEIYYEVQEYVSVQLPVISLYFKTGSVLFDMRVKGIEIPVTSDIFQSIEKWYILS